MVLGCATAAWAQSTGPKIDRVDIKFRGPASVSEEFVRSNIKLKSGASYQPGLTQDDVHLLYGTGQFYNIRVSVDPADDGAAPEESDGIAVNFLIAKQRNGPTGDVNLTFLKPSTRFESAAKFSDEDVPAGR